MSRESRPQPDDFIRAFLRRWHALDRRLRLEVSPNWIGTWRTHYSPGSNATPEPMPWKIFRDWERPCLATPTGAFQDPTLAELVAALMPYQSAQAEYHILSEPQQPFGYPVDFQNKRVGYLQMGGQAQRRRIQQALRLVEFLAVSPEALAAILQAVGLQSSFEAFRILEAWLLQEE
jgi:hypothetical protein